MNWSLLAKVGGVVIGLAPKVYGLIKPSKKKNIERIETVSEIIKSLTQKGNIKMKTLDGYKTHITGAATLVCLGLSYLGWAIDPEILGALIVATIMFLRQGVKKVSK